MKRQQGYGLLLALVVLVVMMTALGLLASSMRMAMLEDKRGLRTVSLIAMTDAAMAETLAHLAQNGSFRGVQEHPFDHGLISSEVRPLDWKRVEILTRATYGEQHRTTRAQVSLFGEPMVLGWQRTR